jgi:allantoinase
VPELLTAYEKLVRQRAPQGTLKDYSDARPPHTEAMSIAMVGSLAHHTGCKNINILHITCRAAMEAALTMRQAYPEINFGLEATASHLLLHHDAPLEVLDVYAKVNPPLRSRADQEYLWEKVLDGTVEWIVTDHANCPRDMKVNEGDPQNIWKAHAGFGGIEYLLPGIYSEGTRRGLPLQRIAAVLSWNPAQRFGLLHKGDIAPGYDADLALLDPNESWTIHYADSPSTQGFTPFEGIEVTGRIKQTFLRGQLVFNNGQVVGEPRGQYQKRPTAAPPAAPEPRAGASEAITR